MRQNLLADYVPARERRCAARDASECGCDADWTPKVEKLVRAWRDMPASEMRLRCGELTAQEIRTVRAILNQILTANANCQENEYCAQCGSDQMPMGDGSCRDCGKPFCMPNAKHIDRHE